MLMKRILILLSLLIAYIYYISSTENGCETLLSIAKDEDKVGYLEKWVNSLEIRDETLKKVNNISGFIQVKNDHLDFGLDWKSIGIPIEFATIVINGSDINYNDISYNKIYSVGFGFGGREFLLIKRYQSKSFGEDLLVLHEDSTTIVKPNVMLVCRI